MLNFNFDSNFKKEIFGELGNFDENMPACEDYELWLRITAKYQILFNAEYLTTKFGGHIDQLSKNIRLWIVFVFMH